MLSVIVIYFPDWKHSKQIDALPKKNIKDAPGAQLRNMFAIITMKITQKSGIRKH